MAGPASWLKLAQPTRYSRHRRTPGPRITSLGASASCASRDERAIHQRRTGKVRSMTRVAYVDSLKGLQEGILSLGSMVEKAIGRSVEALRTQDVALAQRVI